MQQVQKAEVIIVGAGPAGLTAALYLVRYRRDALVLHDGKSRALRIPKTHNMPGFPEGIEGTELIDRMTQHATHYGARVDTGEVIGIERQAGGFRLRSCDGVWECRAVVLATGILLNQIDLPDDQHEAAIRAGVLRYCPICDGYEHRNRRIGVIGCDSNGAAEALFLRQYSRDITLMPLWHPELSPEQLREVADAGISVHTGALVGLQPHSDRFDVRLEGEHGVQSFDVIYPALGCRPRAELAAQLGVALDDKGSIASGAVSDSGVPGLFAAGDVLDGLDQVSVAIGHGALAATAAHNWLREQDRHTLQNPD